jgi:hypothetical protein
VALVHRVPTRQAGLPRLGHLRQNVQSRAYVFTALGVVRGGGQQTGGPVPQTVDIVLVKRLDREAKLTRITADVIQGQKRRIAIERRILEAFRHHRTGDLLKFH